MYFNKKAYKKPVINNKFVAGFLITKKLYILLYILFYELIII